MSVCPSFTCGLVVSLVGSQVYVGPVRFLRCVFLCVWNLGGDVTWLVRIVVLVFVVWRCLLWVLWRVGLGGVVVWFLDEFQFAGALGCGVCVFLCIGGMVSGCD